jgi:hypothetical protein
LVTVVARIRIPGGSSTAAAVGRDVVRDVELRLELCRGERVDGAGLHRLAARLGGRRGITR